MQAYIFVKIHQIIHLKCVYFIVRNLYLGKIDYKKQIGYHTSLTRIVKLKKTSVSSAGEDAPDGSVKW